MDVFEIIPQGTKLPQEVKDQICRFSLEPFMKNSQKIPLLVWLNFNHVSNIKIQSFLILNGVSVFAPTVEYSASAVVSSCLCKVFYCLLGRLLKFDMWLVYCVLWLRVLDIWPWTLILRSNFYFLTIVFNATNSVRTIIFMSCHTCPCPRGTHGKSKTYVSCSVGFCYFGCW